MYRGRDVKWVRHDDEVRIAYLQHMEQPGDAEDTPGRRFATLVRAARKAAGLTQDQLDELSGVSRQTIIRYESGRAANPDAEGVRAICAALGVDPRKAAVALGYLTQEEIGEDFAHRDPSVEEILTLLQDPAVSEADKQAGVSYLRYLRDQARQQQQKAV